MLREFFRNLFPIEDPLPPPMADAFFSIYHYDHDGKAVAETFFMRDGSTITRKIGG